MFLLYAAIKSNVAPLGKILSINIGIVPLQRNFLLKHELGQVLAGAHSRQVNLWTVKLVSCRALKSRWGGDKANESLAGRRGGRGSLGQESMGEQAAH